MFLFDFIEALLKHSFSVCDGCKVPTQGGHYCDDCKSERL